MSDHSTNTSAHGRRQRRLNSDGSANTTQTHPYDLDNGSSTYHTSSRYDARFAPDRPAPRAPTAQGSMSDTSVGDPIHTPAGSDDGFGSQSKVHTYDASQSQGLNWKALQRQSTMTSADEADDESSGSESSPSPPTSRAGDSKGTSTRTFSDVTGPQKLPLALNTYLRNQIATMDNLLDRIRVGKEPELLDPDVISTVQLVQKMTLETLPDEGSKHYHDTMPHYWTKEADRAFVSAKKHLRYVDDGGAEMSLQAAVDIFKRVSEVLTSDWSYASVSQQGAAKEEGDSDSDTSLDDD